MSILSGTTYKKKQSEKFYSAVESFTYTITVKTERFLI